jgi:predicted GNAT family N-acyltransferase
LPEEPPAKFRTEPFDKKKHNRTAFSCEHEALVTYLKHQANQDLKKRVAAVFVLTRDGKTIAGYCTLSQYAVGAGDLPADLLKQLGLPKYDQLPATLLGRLARSLEFKGQGVGELLIMAALRQALDHSKSIASVAVVVDAKDERSKKFYRDFGFIDLPDHPNRLFLLMKTVEQMFAANEDVLPM